LPDMLAAPAGTTPDQNRVLLATSREAFTV
jgi:hypothetical protein